MPEFQAATAFDQPFQEAVDWFLAMTSMPRPEFDKLAAIEKARAFTAAYIYKADELQRVYDAVGAALKKGQTLNDFKKATADMLTRPWHRETVFRTNVLSAYGRGHWEQAQDIKSLRPYARYSAVMDGRTRPSHARLHGLVYPLDSEFWKLYWPPWDYNCRCAAITMSQYDLDKEGLKVSQEIPNVTGPRNNFVSPAAGEWQPELSKYAEEIRTQVESSVKALQARDWKAFDNVAEITQWAERSFTHWNRSLSPDEVEALRLYQSSAYREWNAALRSDAVTDDMRPWINAIDQALQQSALNQDVVVFRGFADEKMLSNFERLPGKIIDDKGYYSTSLDKGVGDKFFQYLKEDGHTPILAEIRVPKGTKAAYLEGTRLLQPYEYEILLSRGTKFKVINAYLDEQGRHRLLLEVIE
jgi:SPP1 gp7 family putative phage head morphogenesis protein